MKKSFAKVSRTALVVLIASVIVLGAILLPQAEASSYQASFIKPMGNVSVNLEEYLDKSVMFELPDHIKDDQNISVIITVDVANLMDAYEQTDKTMSFKDYALTGDAAADITILTGRLLGLAARYGYQALREFLKIKNKRKGEQPNESKSS